MEPRCVTEGRRLTAAEMRELEGLAFADANYGLTAAEAKRYVELREIERSIRRG